jgi:hypothetical protein
MRPSFPVLYLVFLRIGEASNATAYVVSGNVYFGIYALSQGQI